MEACIRGGPLAVSRDCQGVDDAQHVPSRDCGRYVRSHLLRPSYTPLTALAKLFTKVQTAVEEFIGEPWDRSRLQHRPMSWCSIDCAVDLWNTGSMDDASVSYVGDDQGYRTYALGPFRGNV